MATWVLLTTKLEDSSPAAASALVPLPAGPPQLGPSHLLKLLLTPSSSTSTSTSPPPDRAFSRTRLLLLLLLNCSNLQSACSKFHYSTSLLTLRFFGVIPVRREGGGSWCCVFVFFPWLVERGIWALEEGLIRSVVWVLAASTRWGLLSPPLLR